MLAGIRDFLFVWHLPMFLVLTAGWLMGGGWLLLRSLRKTQYPKRIRLSRCVLIFLLAGLGGGSVGLVSFYLLNNIGDAIDVNLKFVGVIVATFALLGVAYLVVYAMLELSMGAALKAAAVPLGAQIVLMGVIGTAGGVPAFYMRHELHERRVCRGNMDYVLDALDGYQRNYQKPVAKLEILVEQNLIEAKHLKCPGAPEREIAFFYYPSRLVHSSKPGQLLLCDYRGNHSWGRNQVMTHGDRGWRDDGQFRALLEADENKEFATALRAAEPD